MLVICCSITKYKPLVEKLFDTARNFYRDNPAKGLQELMDIPDQKVIYLLNENFLQLLENRQISFLDVNYIEASELDRINNMMIIEPHYKLLECIIASGCSLTLEKLIDDNKIDKFKKEELELVVALLKKDSEVLNNKPIIKLNNEIGKLLLTPSKSVAYDLKSLINFINIKDLGNEVFFVAAICNEIDIMKKVEQDSLTSQDILFTALMYGIEENNLAIINYLLSLEKTNINAKDKDGLTPLLKAIELDKPEMVKLLLEHPKIDVNAKNKYCNTPLHFSILRKKFEIVKLLLKHPEIDVNEKDKNGYTILNFFIINDNNTEIVKLLLENPKIDVNAKDIHGCTPLHNAIHYNNTEIVKLLLENPEIEVNEKDKDGNTPLQKAILCNELEMVKLLLKHPNIDVNEKDQDGRTPLHFTIIHNKLEIFKLLLKHPNIDVNEKDQDGHTISQYSINPEFIKLLHEYEKINKDEIAINLHDQEQEVQPLGTECNSDEFI